MGILDMVVWAVVYEKGRIRKGPREKRKKEKEKSKCVEYTGHASRGELLRGREPAEIPGDGEG